MVQSCDRKFPQAGPAAKLHQGSQGDLHQREVEPQEGDQAGGEGVVLQALRPQVPLHEARPQPVFLKLMYKAHSIMNLKVFTL